MVLVVDVGVGGETAGELRRPLILRGIGGEIGGDGGGECEGHCLLQCDRAGQIAAPIVWRYTRLIANTHKKVCYRRIVRR